MSKDIRNVFIIGSKGIPANYGGFETFVEKLTEKQVNKSIKYHVACLSDNNNEFEHNGARCFNVKVPNIGAAKAVYYDIVELRKTLFEKKKLEIIFFLYCLIFEKINNNM